MNIFEKVILVFLTFIFITACSNKPFQPPPPMFKVWAKQGATPQDTVNSMKYCELDEVTGYHKNGSVEGTFTGEKCMKKLGFELNDRYKGICASNIAKETPECKKMLGNNANR